MNHANIETDRLTIALRAPEEVRADIEALDEATRQLMSSGWLRQIAAATSSDPWLHGFRLTERSTGVLVGTAGFKAPPDGDGMVEIAYRIEPGHESRGYATEAAKALIDFAFASSEVKRVRAHTLPEPNASTRVLTKCGLAFIGPVNDPEDGLIWRWEKIK